MPEKFQVVAECPVHEKAVGLIVEADSPREAEEKILGQTVDCPYPIYRDGEAEGHSFTVEKLLSTMPYPWEAPEAISTVPYSTIVTRRRVTSPLGESFWELSRMGERRYRELREEAEKQKRIEIYPRQAGIDVGSAILALIIIASIAGIAYITYSRIKDLFKWPWEE